MSFFGSLFGQEDSIKKVVDGVYNGIDKTFFTDEEKANYFLKLLEAYHPFKLAQRFIALLFVIPYVLTLVVSVFFYFIGYFFANDIFVKGSLDVMNYVNSYLGVPVSVIVGFYFAGGALNSLKGGKI